MISTPYDAEIARLARELRALRRKQREARAGKEKRPAFRKRTVRPAVPKEIRGYWDRIAAMGCILCGAPAEIAHCHGGSIVERMQEPKAKGRKLARYHWLVLPLCPSHGREPYPDALDTNVKAWEAKHGPQAEHLDALAQSTGVDVWARAGIKR